MCWKKHSLSEKNISLEMKCVGQRITCLHEECGHHWVVLYMRLHGVRLVLVLHVGDQILQVDVRFILPRLWIGVCRCLFRSLWAVPDMLVLCRVRQAHSLAESMAWESVLVWFLLCLEAQGCQVLIIEWSEWYHRRNSLVCCLVRVRWLLWCFPRGRFFCARWSLLGRWCDPSRASLSFGCHFLL